MGASRGRAANGETSGESPSGGARRRVRGHGTSPAVRGQASDRAVVDVKRERGASASPGGGDDDERGGTARARAGASAPAPALKVRKPYTITKKRERWTEEEHVLFLESLKAHGRAWRKIEEHIGTKTAVQIRSHAQKFFSKLQREASKKGDTSGSENAGARAGDVENESKRTSSKMTTSSGGGGGGSVGKFAVDVDIEIPPARPKRKPAHPYPRKATSQPSGSGGTGGSGGSGGTGGSGRSGGSGGSGGADGNNSGGTGKSTQTAQKSVNVEESKEHVAHAASSAAVAAVLSVASDSMQCTLQADMRAGYFGVPQAYPGMMNMPMVNPYLGVANAAPAGIHNQPSSMNNPQQFLNYISMLSNMWGQKAAAALVASAGTDQSGQEDTSGKTAAVLVDRRAAAQPAGKATDGKDSASGKKSAFSSIGPRPVSAQTPVGTAPLTIPFTTEQFGTMQAHFASIMQAAAMGYMGQQNANPMMGTSGFISGTSSKVPVHASQSKCHSKAVTSARDAKNADNGSDGSDKSDDGQEDDAQRNAQKVDY